MCGIVGVVARSPVNQLLYDGMTVLQHRGQVQPKLGMSEYIITQFLFRHAEREYTARPAESMHPAQPGQTETASARLPELFMQVAFFSPVAPKLRMKAEPGLLAATEDA